MATKDICNLKIKQFSDEICACFMWVTCAHLPDALDVFVSWGFKYKTVAFVWIKETSSGKIWAAPSPYTLKGAELCLLGVKGAVSSHRIKNNVRQVVFALRKRHSEKPQEVRNRIIELMGDLPRIELFARSSKKIENGWVNVGDGVDGCDIRDSLKKIVDGTYL